MKVLDSVGSLVVSAGKACLVTVHTQHLFIALTEYVRVSSVILDRCLWLAMLPWEQVS